MKLFRLFLILVFVNSGLYSQVIINEFMASNVSEYPDMVDFDDFSDWIELHNSSSQTVDLNGYYLTDNLNEPLKWHIPIGASIAPGGYLVIRADGYDSRPGKYFYREFWPWDIFRTTYYHTNFKLGSAGEEIGLFKSGITETINLIILGSTWNYFDEGSNPGDEWQRPEYDDSMWKSGNAELGYGDGDENTIVSYGPDEGNKYITTYFRKEFTVNSLQNVNSLELNILRDDGAIVYINGIEVARTNMPGGPVNLSTTANAVVGGMEEEIFFNFELDSGGLHEGTNLIAAEVHQVSPTSSDISFNLQLMAYKKTGNGVVQLADSVRFSRQLPDVSFGRSPQNGNGWYYFGEPTPGSANLSEALSKSNYSGAVTVSHESGYYGGPVDVSLNSASGTGNIYYRMNEVTETSSWQRYVSPLAISTNSVLETRLVEPGKLPGPVAAKTYFINEETKGLPVISLNVASEYFWDNSKGIYANNHKGREVPIVLEYYEPGGNPAFKVNAGATIGGYNIWRFAQKPINIELNSRYENDFINYQLFDKNIGEFTKIGLRNGGDNWPTTMLQDAMLESIVKNQMNNGVQAYKPCVVYLNGQYWGIHNIREKFDAHYFANNFNVPPDAYEHLRYNYFGPDETLDYIALVGNLDEYDAMITYVKSHDMSKADNYSYMASLIDIDSFIDYIAAQIYVCNTSWKHNREWWRPLHNGGKWQWLISDIDRGFNIEKVADNLLGSFISEYSLFNNLLDNDNFRNRFIQKTAAHINGTFATERLVNIVDSLTAIVSSEMPYHIQRWQDYGGIPSIQDWLINKENVKDFIRLRSRIVLAQIASRFSLEDAANLTINKIGNGSGFVRIYGTPLPDNTANLKFFKGIPLTIEAVPVAGSRFTGWNGIIQNSDFELILLSDSTITATFEKITDSILPDTISSNTTLTKVYSPYYTTGDITVAQNVKLSIEQGVDIKIGKGHSIYIKGSLEVNGTSDNPVSFLPDSTGGVKNWGALCFSNLSDTSYITHAIIKGATNGKDAVLQKAAISGYYANLVIDGLIMNEVNFPIFTQYGYTVLSNSEITTNVTCDYINVKYGYGHVENNTFYGNKAPDTDAIDFDGVADGLIIANRIYNFTGSNCDAIDIGEASQNVLIRSNLIYNCRDKGVSVGQKSSVQLERNVIFGCIHGIAVKDSSFARIINNTFFMNGHAVSCFEKNYGQGGGNAVISNTIMSASKKSSYYSDSQSSVTISYSLSDMDILPGTGNLYSNPIFTDEFNYNLQLEPDSPCIGAGNPESPPGAESSIGAYYIYKSSDYPENLRESLSVPVVINEIMYNDGESSNSKDWIEIYNVTGESIDISSWQLTDEDSVEFFAFPTGTILHAEGFIVACKDTSSFKSAYPGVSNYIGEFLFGLDGNDRLTLSDTSGGAVTFLSYHNSGSWPVEPDGFGYSLELSNPEGINYRTTNWGASQILNGTPGEQNSIVVSYVNPDAQLPNQFTLHQNYPNPFNPATVIEYSIPKNSELAYSELVTLKVFDVLGREVSELVDKPQAPGNYKVQFNAGNLASGVYFYSIRAGNFTSTKKMLLLR